MCINYRAITVITSSSYNCKSPYQWGKMVYYNQIWKRIQVREAMLDAIGESTNRIEKWVIGFEIRKRNSEGKVLKSGGLVGASVIPREE